MEINKYPDDTSYVNDTKLGEQIFRINTYEDLFHLKQFVDAFHNEWSNKITRIRPNIIIPNLIDAQADRRFKKGESFGLKLVLEFLSNLEANFKIFHPHNSEVVEMGMELLGNSVEIIDNSEFIKEVLLRLYTDYSKKDLLQTDHELILLSTDGGSYKWINKLADKIDWKGEVYGASKSRNYINGQSKLTQYIDRQDFQGKDVLILDDISIRGGTFIGLAKMLRERNCGKLYLAVSHITIPILTEEFVNSFDKIFTTDSKGFNYKVIGSGHDKIGYTPENLEIINFFN